MKRTPNFKSQSLLSLTIFYIVHVLFFFSSKVLFYIFINQLLHQMEKRDSNIDSEKLYRAQTPI